MDRAARDRMEFAIFAGIADEVHRPEWAARRYLASTVPATDELTQAFGRFNSRPPTKLDEMVRANAETILGNIAKLSTIAEPGVPKVAFFDGTHEEFMRAIGGQVDRLAGLSSVEKDGRVYIGTAVDLDRIFNPPLPSPRSFPC